MNEKVKKILEWCYCIILAIILALLVRYFIGEPTVVKQRSMNPTLIENQKVWLNKWDRTRGKLPKRGEIITLESPSKKNYTEAEAKESNNIAKYENEPQGIWNKFSYYVLELNKESYIKRVIGLPGEHVEIKDNKVYINGEELEEDYLPEGVKTQGRTFSDFKVPANCVFAMGDNREQSLDCRDFGCIPLEKIEGKVLARIWPLNVFGKVK